MCIVWSILCVKEYSKKCIFNSYQLIRILCIGIDKKTKGGILCPFRSILMPIPIYQDFYKASLAAEFQTILPFFPATKFDWAHSDHAHLSAPHIANRSDYDSRRSDNSEYSYMWELYCKTTCAS